MKSLISHTATKKTWSHISARSIKYVIGVGLVGALAYQLKNRLVGVNISDINISTQGLALILLVVFLASINWAVEARKWLFTMSTQSLTFIEALKTVLVGLSFAILTPGRVGDYAGRAMHSKHRQQALLATFQSSMAQMAITLGFGLVACFMLLETREFGFAKVSPFWLLLPLLMGLLLYFRIEILVKHLPRFIKNKLPKLDFRSLSYEVKATVLGLSAIRYGVYVIQSVLLLWAFQLNIPLIDAILGVSILFLIQTMIPMPMLFQVATKIELGLLIWAPFDPSAANLSIVMVVLWGINVVIPALVGYRIANFNNILIQKNVD